MEPQPSITRRPCAIAFAISLVEFVAGRPAHPVRPQRAHPHRGAGRAGRGQHRGVRLDESDPGRRGTASSSRATRAWLRRGSCNMTEVPVIVLDHLTDTQRRALVLADNRLALSAGWDEEMLRVELESLKEDAFDLDLVGFTDEEIEEILDRDQTKTGLTDDDDAPEPAGDGDHGGRRRVGAGRAPAAVRRRHGPGGRGKSSGRRLGRHGVHRPAVQHQLRGSHREEAQDQERRARVRSSTSSCGTPPRTCSPSARARCTSACPRRSCTRSGRRSWTPEATGRGSSSG